MRCVIVFLLLSVGCATAPEVEDRETAVTPEIESTPDGVTGVYALKCHRVYERAHLNKRDYLCWSVDKDGKRVGKAILYRE